MDTVAKMAISTGNVSGTNVRRRAGSQRFYQGVTEKSGSKHSAPTGLRLKSTMKWTHYAEIKQLVLFMQCKGPKTHIFPLTLLI